MRGRRPRRTRQDPRHESGRPFERQLRGRLRNRGARGLDPRRTDGSSGPSLGSVGAHGVRPPAPKRAHAVRPYGRNEFHVRRTRCASDAVRRLRAVLTSCRWYLSLVGIVAKTSSKRQTARVFTTGRSQAVRLPKEFRFDSETVLIHREGSSVILEPVREWPAGYVESFAGVPEDFERPPQGNVDKRRKL